MAEHAKPRVIVTGFVGLFPVGGVAWDYVQYVLGFEQLGWDVIYLEDTRTWPVYQHGVLDGSRNAAHVARTMAHFGLGGQWAYRDEMSGQCFGLSESALREFCRTADVFLNLSCSTTLREEYASIPVRALVDTDPMFTQIQFLNGKSLSGGPTGMRQLVAEHTHRFTFGAGIGREDCRVPTLGLEWHPTRQPIVLERWQASEPPRGPADYYSTVMNWSVEQEVEFQGEHWGQKDVELMRFLHLPQRVPGIPLALAVGQAAGARFPAQTVRDAGWLVLAPQTCVPDVGTYQDFIVASRGEFSVAKETYVKANTGWFSCRSACYLAAGRAVVAQDTSWSQLLPHDRGLLAFHDEETAADALRRVEADPVVHSKAARAIAEEYFDSRRVLRDLLARVGW